MKRSAIVIFGLAVVAGLGYAGWTLVERLDRAGALVAELSAEIVDLEDEQESLEDQMDEVLNSASPDLSADLASLGEELDKLDRRQRNDIIEVYELIGAGATLSRGTSSGATSIEVSAGDIDRPAYCFPGDPVYWGWNGGLDCRR